MTSERENYQSPREIMEKRIKALQVIDAEFGEIHSSFNSEIFNLEIEHGELLESLFEKRRRIISGEYEPTAEDLKNPSKYEAEEYKQNYDRKIKGIPKFWQTVLKKSPVSVIIEEYDEPVLYHLEDIKVELFHIEDIKVNVDKIDLNYYLEFYFSENEYFTDKVLTRYHSFVFDPSMDELDREEPKIINYQGCNINWKDGKNVTITCKEKIIRDKKTNIIGSQTESTTRSSFFNFFYPPTKTVADYETNPCKQDFNKIARHLKNSIIPKAFQYYTGEVDEMDSGFVLVNI